MRIDDPELPDGEAGAPPPALAIAPDAAEGSRLVDKWHFAAADRCSLASKDHGWGTQAAVRHVATLGVPPPHDPHDRVQSERFLRALLLRCLVVSLAVWLLVALILDLSNWWLVLGGVSMVLLAADVFWLTFRVRRDERRAAGT